MHLTCIAPDILQENIASLKLKPIEVNKLKALVAQASVGISTGSRGVSALGALMTAPPPIRPPSASLKSSPKSLSSPSLISAKSQILTAATTTAAGILPLPQKTIKSGSTLTANISPKTEQKTTVTNGDSMAGRQSQLRSMAASTLKSFPAMDKGVLSSQRYRKPVFISFRVKEGLVEARMIAQRLMSNLGVDAFVSEDDIVSGDDW